jgi:hypothetical protein
MSYTYYRLVIDGQDASIVIGPERLCDEGNEEAAAEFIGECLEGYAADFSPEYRREFFHEGLMASLFPLSVREVAELDQVVAEMDRENGY